MRKILNFVLYHSTLFKNKADTERNSRKSDVSFNFQVEILHHFQEENLAVYKHKRVYQKMGKTKHKKRHRHDEGDEDAGDDATNAGLKLILKVGSKGHEKHKKKKKKKDKKKERDKDRKHHHHHHKEKRLTSSGSGSNGTGNDQESRPEVVKIEEMDEESPKKALTRLLEQMLNHLQKKDTHGFFANPVNDQIAPGYSSIISQPMDFSSIRVKLPSYDTLALFRTDFELICRNAMTYNTVDTIYYKSADKLLRYGQKFFSVEKLRSMKTHLAFANIIPDECLGIDATSVLAHEDTNENDDVDDDVGDVSKVIEDIREHSNLDFLIFSVLHFFKLIIFE